MLDPNYALTLVVLVVLVAISLGDRKSAIKTINVLRDAIKRIGKK